MQKYFRDQGFAGEGRDWGVRPDDQADLQGDADAEAGIDWGHQKTAEGCCVLVPPEEPQEARGMNMKTSPQERTMNTNTELPKNAKLLTVEEAKELVNNNYRYYVNGDGLVKIQYSISPQPLHGTEFLVVGSEEGKCLIVQRKEFSAAIKSQTTCDQ